MRKLLMIPQFHPPVVYSAVHLELEDDIIKYPDEVDIFDNER